MGKNIITISRQFGSGGRTVGKFTAELLGVPYYDKELVKHVAVETGFAEEFVERQGEEVSPWKSLFSYAFAGMNGHRPMNGLSADDFLWAIQCKVIIDLAQKGPCVIVGRCADYILREREDVLHAFIHADIKSRAERIVRLYGESENAPEKRLEDKDKRRRAYYKHYTGREWGDYRNFDLSLNTGVVGIRRAAEMIVAVAKEPICEI